jgi:hypothetical protein
MLACETVLILWVLYRDWAVHFRNKFSSSLKKMQMKLHAFLNAKVNLGCYLIIKKILVHF